LNIYIVTSLLVVAGHDDHRSAEGSTRGRLIISKYSLHSPGRFGHPACFLSCSRITSLPHYRQTGQSPSDIDVHYGVMSDARFTIEVCVDSLESAIKLVSDFIFLAYFLRINLRRLVVCPCLCSAVNGGADRLEICANIGLGGGTTPSLGLVRTILQRYPSIPLMARSFLWPIFRIFS
jgi:hypothetical protein